MVRLILAKDSSRDTLFTLAHLETDAIEQIYCQLYNIK